MIFYTEKNIPYILLQKPAISLSSRKYLSDSTMVFPSRRRFAKRIDTSEMTELFLARIMEKMAPHILTFVQIVTLRLGADVQRR